jgi:hypothetical protein
VIEPIFKTPLFRTAMEPTNGAVAIVPIEFGDVLKVNVPDPINRALVAPIAPLWLANPVVVIDSVPIPEPPAYD